MHIVPLMTILMPMLMLMLDVLSMDVDFVTFNSQKMRERKREIVYVFISLSPISHPQYPKCMSFPIFRIQIRLSLFDCYSRRILAFFFLVLRLLLFVSHQYLSKILFLFHMHVVDFPLIWCTVRYFFSFLWSNQFSNIKLTIFVKFVFAFHSSFIETNRTISIKRKHYLYTITIHRQISGFTFWMQKKCKNWTRQRQRHTNLNTFVASNWTNLCRFYFYFGFFSLSVFVLFFQTVDFTSSISHFSFNSTESTRVTQKSIK